MTKKLLCTMAIVLLSSTTTSFVYGAEEAARGLIAFSQNHRGKRPRKAAFEAGLAIALFGAEKENNGLTPPPSPARKRPPLSPLRNKKNMDILRKARTFICSAPGCSFETKYKQNLIPHRRTHTDEKPFACDWKDCRYSAKISSHLRRHILTHTGEKPHKCPKCTYAATRSSLLTKHTKKHH